MINHYLLTLTPEQEGRVLTREMLPYPMSESSCLVQTARGDGMNAADACEVTRWPKARVEYKWEWSWRLPPAFFAMPDNWRGYQKFGCSSVGGTYDHLCWRFGHTRINAAIRNRVLTNIARRTLAPTPAGVVA